MMPGALELKWAYVLLGLVAVLDLLIISRTIHILSHRATQPIPLEAPWVLLIVIGLQVLLVWLFGRLRQVVSYYRRLKESYEEDLDFTRQVIESVAHGLTVVDENGKFVYVNKAYADMLGLKPEQIVGRSPFDFTLPDDHVSLTKAREKREQGQQSTYLSRLRRADGTTLMVRVTGTPRWHHGRVVGNFAAVVPWDEPFSGLN